VTHIADRESDMYEEFATVPNRDNHVLVRAHIDRRLVGKSQSLYTYLNQQTSEGTYTVDVPADARIGRTAREALLIVRRAMVKIQRPDKLKLISLAWAAGRTVSIAASTSGTSFT